MAEIRDALGLDPDDLPDYSTIYKSFDRLKNVGMAGAAARFRAAAPAVRTRCARQHVSSTGDVRHRTFVSGQDERYRR